MDVVNEAEYTHLKKAMTANFQRLNHGTYS